MSFSRWTAIEIFWRNFLFCKKKLNLKSFSLVLQHKFMQGWLSNQPCVASLRLCAIFLRGPGESRLWYHWNALSDRKTLVQYDKLWMSELMWDYNHDKGCDERSREIFKMSRSFATKISWFFFFAFSARFELWSDSDYWYDFSENKNSTIRFIWLEWFNW